MSHPLDNPEESSLEDLKAMRKSLDESIRNRNEEKRLEALRAAQAAASEHGFTLQQLIFPEKKSALPACYADPRDPSKTWCGRGRRPKWVVALLNNGHSLEDLRV